MMNILPIWLLATALNGAAEEQPGSNPALFLRQGMDQVQADHVVGPIYKARGFGNTFMISNQAGNAVIDTSLVSTAPHHVKLLRAVDDRPVDYIILTHAHRDHTGGISLWRDANTQVIAQSNSVEFLHYQERLRPFFQHRNAAQFGFPLLSLGSRKTDNFGATIPADILFDAAYSVELGELTLEIMHAPSETHDALIVWVPELKAVFTGDLYYESFPNIYTLRGTKPRWALDYVASLNKVLALEPEYLLPSHGEPLVGADNIRKVLIRYRDAITYVHDAVVTQLNAGASVTEAMRAVQIPPELDIGEAYGRVDWSVRGIYEGYAGWFDGNPVSMYPVDQKDTYRELVALAGGSDKVVKRAQALFGEGQTLAALQLTDAILALDPGHKATLILRAAAFQKLEATSTNFNETGWLQHGARSAQETLDD